MPQTAHCLTVTVKDVSRGPLSHLCMPGYGFFDEGALQKPLENKTKDYMYLDAK